MTAGSPEQVGAAVFAALDSRGKKSLQCTDALHGWKTEKWFSSSSLTAVELSQSPSQVKESW